MSDLPSETPQIPASSTKANSMRSTSPTPAASASRPARILLGLVYAILLMVFVGLVSALVALGIFEIGGMAGLKALGQGGVQPASISQRLRENRQQLNALQATVTQATSQQSNQGALQAADLKALTSELARLDQKITSQEDGLALRFEAIQPKLDQSRAQGEQALAAANEALSQTRELAGLVDPEGALSGELQATIARLEGRLDQMAEQISQAQAAATAVQADRSAQDLAAQRLTDRVDGLAADIKGQLTVLSALEDQLAGLAQAQDQLTDSAQDLRQNLEGQLAELSAAIDPAYRENRDDGLRLLALSRLRAALEQTHGFAGELAALQGLAGDKPKLAQILDPLSELAGRSTPSREELSAQTDALWRDLSALARSDASANQGVFGSVLGKMQGLVTVEPVDARGQESLAGWLADAHAALASDEAGRADYALAWDKLGRIPGELASRSQLYQTWFAALEQRRARDEAAWALEAWTLEEKLSQP